MKWTRYLQPAFILPLLLWILLSFRIYHSSLWKTFIDSEKIFIGSGLYGLGMTIIFNGLSAKITKKSLNREQFIKMALWLAVITAFSASLEHYFHIFGSGR